MFSFQNKNLRSLLESLRRGDAKLKAQFQEMKSYHFEEFVHSLNVIKKVCQVQQVCFQVEQIVVTLFAMVHPLEALNHEQQ